jgi:hypothetical protein
MSHANIVGADCSQKLQQLCHHAAEGIYEESLSYEDSAIESGLSAILGSQALSLIKQQGIPALPLNMLVSKRLDDLIFISYGRFHAYKFQDLPYWWRQLYTDASILKFYVLLLASSLFTSGQERQHDGGVTAIDFETSSTKIDAMVEVLDLALIRAGGAGEKRGKRWIGQALKLLEEVWSQKSEGRADEGSSEPPNKKLRTSISMLSEVSQWEKESSFCTNQAWAPPVTNPVHEEKGWSLGKFEEYANSTKHAHGPSPVIFKDLIQEWPALTSHPWAKPRYLCSRMFGGRRLVPVEIGRSYVDEGWGQELITFRDLLDKYIEPRAQSLSGETQPQRTSSTGYLAQHELFSQIPELRKDIAIPEFCWADVPQHPVDDLQNQPRLSNPAENAWFGPAGTITPLHTDSYHNLLCQVVGSKYIRLYSPFETPSLRPRGVESGVSMDNTSSIDVGFVEGWDEDDSEIEGGSGMDWSGFKEVPFVDCILRPGDTLYIPIGWWHYVRSLSVSFSVSFWWN